MSTKLLAYIFLTIAMIAWGGNFVVARAVHSEIPPIGLAFWRWFLATLCLLPFALTEIYRKIGVIRENFRRISVAAFFGISLFHILVYGALNTTTAITGGLILALIPAITPFISWVLLRERCSLKQIFGIGISTIGVLSLLSRGDLDVILNLDFVLGDGLMLLAAFAWAVYSVLVKELALGLSPKALLSVLMLLGSVIILPFYVLETIFLRSMPFGMETLWVFTYIVLIASVLAMICFNIGVSSIGPSRSSPFQHLIPVSAAVLSVTFLGETFEFYHGVGFLVITLGLFLANYGQKL